MPQSSIFGSNLSHPFAQQPDFVNVQGFGGQNEQTIRLKRKDSFTDNAGKFEIGQIFFGPSEQKRARRTIQTELNTALESQDIVMCTESGSKPISESLHAPICNSMVTHMTTSFLQDGECSASAKQDTANDQEICSSMETDEQVTTGLGDQDTMKIETPVEKKTNCAVDSWMDYIELYHGS